ncbi:MAG: class I SAM-dependent methyltransferase [Gloeomargaritaceae cyanobacterium C42_A2020_066]|nr:class I SAM-dependent methyltransferase [Gloeomargaritaceae cyanobacterium C42_A2020_066]
MNCEAYDAIASQWAQTRVQLSEVERQLLTRLCEDLAPGSEILDLGCGTGKPIAEHLVNRAFRITGVDQSAQMLAIAQRLLPEQVWVLASLETFVPTHQYSAVIAWDSLFHIPRGTHPSIFQRVRQCLPVGGKFALTVGGSARPAFTDRMFDQTFFYDSHSPEVALTLLQRVQFEIIHTEFLNLPTSGRDKGRFAIIARAA